MKYLLLLLCACREPLDQRLAIVDEPRVLAVLADPPEARPDEPISYSIVLALSDATPSWSYCTAPKPPTEDNAVSAACLDSSSLLPLGTSATVTANLPHDACTQFGPDTPPGDFRPRDPDSTGGYYQPIRADVPGIPDLAFGLARITCDLPTAPAEVAHDYQLHYVANANPTLDSFELMSAPIDSDVPLTASWPAAAAESYLYYDLPSQQLVTRRESMRVSWYATGGTLPVDATRTDDATSVSTTWHTPTAAGTYSLWLVLRDSRGGTAARSFTVDVR